MFSRGQRLTEYNMAMVFERMDRQDEKIEQLLKKPSNFSGFWSGLLSASSSANGTVTGGDVIVSGLTCVVGATAGGLTSVALFLSDASWIDPAIPFQVGSILGFTVCCAKLTIDGVLYDLINRPRGPKEEKPEKRKPASRPLPVYNPEHQPPEVDKVQLLPNGQEIIMSDLRNFLETATGLYDKWGTKSWAREAWTEGGVVGYPPLGSLKTRVWAGVRELCADWATQYQAFTNGGGKSRVWQTNDRHLIEQFIEMLEGDDDV